MNQYEYKEDEAWLAENESFQNFVISMTAIIVVDLLIVFIFALLNIPR
jgi:hypothetical protein